MDWHGTLETTFLVAFWAGLAFTLASAMLSGAFHHEFGAGSAFGGGHATDLGGPDVETGIHDAGHAHVGWAASDFPGASPLSPTVIASALTGFGAIGYMSLQHWQFGVGASVALGLVGSLILGGATFAAMVWLFSSTQASSHMIAAGLVGTKAPVFTAIGSGSAGAITIESQGTRMTVPARAVDASEVPVGAEVEIERIDGGVYIVAETRESWVARSKTAPKGEQWS